MRKLILFFLLVPVSLLSQVSVEWVDGFGGISIALDEFNNVFTINYSQSPGGDITLTKRDTNGNVVWDATYNNTDNTKFESANWVSVDSENNIIVVGDVNSGISSPVKANSLIMKFNQQGDLIWRHVFETTFDGSYTKRCLTDAANNIYVLGVGSGPNGFVTKVKKFDADGNAVWNYFDTAGIGSPQHFKLTPEGNLLIIARATVGNLNGYLKINTDGELLWALAGVPSLAAGDADGDSFGNSYLVHSQTAGGGGSTIKKVSPTGNIIWENTFSLTAFKLEVGNDDLPIICGYPNSGSPGASFKKINSDGTLVWENVNADGAMNLLTHSFMVLDQFNNAYLAASTLFEMAICKVNADGTNGWVQTTSGSYASVVQIGSDYNVYLTGGNTAKFAQDQTLGCTDAQACNFSPSATADDGSCEYISCSCLGDINDDGVVNVADVLTFLMSYGCTGDCGAADLNNDGAVNSADLLIIISSLGATCL